MIFEPSEENFIRLLPSYLTDLEKGRLLKALEQFKEDKGKAWNSKFNTNFYTHRKYDFFLQGDLIRQVRYAVWNKDKKCFDKIYLDAMILSNTCDLDLSNGRNIPKEVVLAPIVRYSQYTQKLSERLGVKDLSTNLHESIKGQVYSSLLYLPTTPYTNEDFICHLDKAFWFPTEELNSYLPEIDQNRIASLDYFGYYLFLVKLSYHFCRLPEEKQR
jgi:hypothetical protein